METPRAFLLRRHDEVLLAAVEEDDSQEPWRTRLAMLRGLSEWEWAESAFAVALGEFAAGTVYPVRSLDPQVARAFAGDLLREWEARS